MILNPTNINDAATDFREDMLEFSDADKYPDAIIKKCLYRANHEIGKRWGAYIAFDPTNFARLGLHLFAAHWLVTMYGDQSATPENTITDPPQVAEEKRIGDEEVKYRINSIQKVSDAWLSTTVYGVQFQDLRTKLIGGFAIGGKL
jgi:hypothetical protein